MRKRSPHAICDLSESGFQKVVQRIRKGNDAYDQFARLLRELEAEATRKPTRVTASKSRAA